MDGCDFCTRCTKEFGNKGALPFGYYDQEKPEQDLVTGKNLPWKTAADFDSTKNKKPSMKVGEIREKLEEQQSITLRQQRVACSECIKMRSDRRASLVNCVKHWKVQPEQHEFVQLEEAA